MAALACGIGLGGCVEENAAQAPVAAAPSDNIARRPDVSPAGATVAVASISGAPGGLGDKYQAMLATFAKRGNVSLADAGGANYLVRAYLSAYPEGDTATAVAYVLDVFDAGKRRTQRVEDEVVVRGTAPDPWSLVSDDVLAAVAQKSAADLAAVMTNTPEAIAAASTPPAGGASTQVAANGANGASPAPAQVAAAAPAAPPQDGQTVVAATPPASSAASAVPQGASATPSGNGDGMTAQR
ncbi:MAG: hypothetical protein AB1508_07805 [Pseudomonadota bacterium]